MNSPFSAAKVPFGATVPHSLALWVGAVWSVLVLAVSLTVAWSVFSAGPVRGLSGAIYIDALGALMLVLIGLVGLAASLYSVPYMSHELSRNQITPVRLVLYVGWLQLFQFTMVAAVAVENLGLLWVAVEATTLVSAILVGLYDRRESLEAAWKYVILCGVGIAFAMLGIIFLYSAAVRAGVDHRLALNWTELMAAAGRLDPASVRMAFALALVGFGTKAGLAPMHSWLPDAHSQAPAPVSALLSGVLLNTAVYAILRFYTIAGKALGPAFPANALLAFGLISLVIATLFILVQRDFKRMLAYSSVEHMGLICVGVGIGGPLGLFGAVLHMVGHALAKSVLFCAAGNLGHRYHTYRIGRIRGAVRALPVTGPLLVAGVLAITGMPPSALFLSEFAIVAAGFAGGRAWVAALVLAAIGLAFAGMLLHLREMAFGEIPHGIATGEQMSWGEVPLLLLLALCLLLGIWVPPWMADGIRQVAALLEGGV